RPGRPPASRPDDGVTMKYLMATPAGRHGDCKAEHAAPREVRHTLARPGGVNIVCTPDCDAKITVSLASVAWREAIDTVARMAHCRVKGRWSVVVLEPIPPESR